MSDIGDAPRVTTPDCVSEETLRTIPLMNGMVDVAIVFGFDETCSRELAILDEDEVSWERMAHLSPFDERDRERERERDPMTSLLFSATFLERE